ncbi:hypothetical protein AOLI_G00288080 [Acnodon oligacanthus]
MAARGIVWSQEETAALLDIWKEDHIKQKDGSSVALGDSNPDESDASADTSGCTDPPPVVKRPSSKSKHPNAESPITEVASMISSIIEQQRRDFELFVSNEDERHCREMELERERLRLQMEMEERCRQAQMESDQAMMRMVTQVMGAAISHTSPIPTHFPTPTCTTEVIPTFHLFTPAHRPSPMPSTNNQESFSHGSNEPPLSSLLHEINRFNS